MVPPLPELPQFSLNVTNYLQAFILDGNNVIDYVQLCGPNSSGGVNQALADPNYPEPNNVYYQWSTNAVPYAPPTPYGVLNQLWVSGHPTSAPGTGGQWSIAATPMGVNSPSAEAAYFNGFFVPTFQWQGMTYVNSHLLARDTRNRLSLLACMEPAYTKENSHKSSLATGTLEQKTR